MAHDDYTRGIAVLTGTRRAAAPSRTLIGQERHMPSVPHKSFFERTGQQYEHDEIEGGYVAFLVAMRCDSAIFHFRAYRREKVREALQAGLKVWFYGGPDDWYPSNMHATRDAIKTILVNEDPRCSGYIANVERIDAPRGRDQQDDWGSATDAQVAELAAMLHEDSQRWSVGFCSIPAWGRFRTIARLAPHVWGSPQLYGVVSPGTPAELLSRGRAWAVAFCAYAPCLAAWARTAPELRAYLDGMRSVPNALFWHTTVPRGDSFDALRDFQPGTRSGGGWGGVLAALGIGVLGGLITAVLTDR